MSEVTIRELCNRGCDVVDRVQRGERLTITRSGRPLAELRPLRRRALDASTLLERWHHLPPVDPLRLRADIDDVMDSSL